jgi:DNA-binding response OmpR family regulator
MYQHLRDDDYDFPVIFVTAKGELEDRLHGLRMGADDYICKPFQPAELTARVEAVLRRYLKSTVGERQQLRTGTIDIDVAALQVTLPHPPGVVSLTHTEMRVLLFLAQHAGRAISRESLMENVWGENFVGESNIVDVYIRRLRRKIEPDPANPAIIQSARGIGYRFATT